MELKVGDSARVFEIIDPIYELSQKGKQVCEVKSKYFGNNYGVDVYPKLNIMAGGYGHYGIDERKQAKLIGRLIITKVHGN